jgi:hypothetical protein
VDRGDGVENLGEHQYCTNTFCLIKTSSSVYSTKVTLH